MALFETALTGWPKRQGKVRDVYDLGDRLLMVATDRISAYDWVLPTPIPGKGRVLTGLSLFWFTEFHLGVPNHLITADLARAGLHPPLPAGAAETLQGRSMVVKKAQVVPFECVVRGYLSGSGWREYRKTGAVCGLRLPAGLVESDRLPGPLFTPATKAETGHDENIPFATMASALGADLAERLRTLSIQVYERAAAHAQSCGLILADTKFEWGFDTQTGELLLVDEVLTPDSSRFWPQDAYRPGGPQPSFDKQFVRDWLDQSGWDKASPPPSLPDAVVARTQQKYSEAYERLTGRALPRGGQTD